MNLLQETTKKLMAYHKTWNDVLWIGGSEFTISIEDFKRLANREYDNGFGCVEINDNLVLVGDTFWLERHTYDGSEWWEYKEIPKYKDENEVTIDKITFRYPVYGFLRRLKND